MRSEHVSKLKGKREGKGRAMESDAFSGQQNGVFANNVSVIVLQLT